MSLPRILIIEDEPAIADTLIYALRTEGFAPEWCATGRAGLAAVAAKAFALVVLDVGLPDGSGFEVCKAIRARSAVPVIFLTAHNTELDRVLGLELGGDDYLAKPFSPRELTARVKAILRRANGGNGTLPLGSAAEEHSSAPGSDRGAGKEGGGGSGGSGGNRSAEAEPGRARGGVRGGAAAEFLVDAERCTISFRGTALALTRYEFRLLKLLVERPGRVFSRDQLMTAVWEDPGASLDRTVDAHVKTLRAKLRAAGADEEAIQTHRGLGYSLRETGAQRPTVSGPETRGSETGRAGTGGNGRADARG